MIQYGLNFQIPIKGAFTEEKFLLGKSLYDMEDILGFQKGRLIQGADIFLLSTPRSIADFKIMLNTIIPAHKLDNSIWLNAANKKKEKERALKLFRRTRLIKVVPLKIHVQAMRQYLTEEEYYLIKDLTPKGISIGSFKKELRYRFRNHPETLKKLDNDFLKIRELFRKNEINDKLYPHAKNGGASAWELVNPIPARCICRLLNYTEDRYQGFL